MAEDDERDFVVKDRVRLIATRVRSGLGWLHRSVGERARSLRNVRAWSCTRPVGIEMVLDGASLLNWRSSVEVDGIVLTPGDGLSEPFRSGTLSGSGPSHGKVDLQRLVARRYTVTAETAGGIAPVTPIDPGSVVATKNEGRVGDEVWALDNDSSGGLMLVSESLVDRGPRVHALESGMGVILMTVGPLPDDLWTVELRERGTDARLAGARTAARESKYIDFRFSLPQWSEAPLKGTGEITRWDFFAVRPEGERTGVRLAWGGSSIVDVRSAQRFRRSFSRGSSGVVTRVRPYWTKDQYLSVELSRLENVQGAHA